MAMTALSFVPPGGVLARRLRFPSSRSRMLPRGFLFRVDDSAEVHRKVSAEWAAGWWLMGDGCIVMHWIVAPGTGTEVDVA